MGLSKVRWFFSLSSLWPYVEFVRKHGEVCQGEHRGCHCELELYAFQVPPNILLKKTWRTFNFLMDDRQILSPTLKVLSIFNITRHVPYNSVKMKNCCFYCNLIYSVSLHIQTCYIYELRCNTWGVAHVIFIYNFRTAFVNQASEKIKHHYFFSGLPKKIHS